MITYKIVPQLREKCIIQGHKEELSNIKEGDTIFIIANKPFKKFSIISEIGGIHYDEKKRIFVDERNLGNFGKNDEVFILKYNPAEAIEIHIDISSSYSLISRGEWTEVVRPSIKEKLIDIGQEVSFLISWEGGAPIVASGFVNKTFPNPPVIVGSSTRIFIEKSSDQELLKLKQENLIRKELRVNILQNEIEHKTIELIKEIKQGSYPNQGQKYQFKATNPKVLFRTLSDLLKSFEVIEAPIEQILDDEEQDYLASAVFLKNPTLDSLQLIDIQILASGYTGTLLIWVTGKNSDIIKETLEDLDIKVNSIKEELEKKVQILNIQCPECGAPLPIKQIDIEGKVKCVHCGRVSKIPKALRY
ncbi:MAG: hypothetical protein GF353_05735 [Candidatus Lokiarchaeota archaeon]|nr:hypothetical protein [Candidatus Lokiarchaeota archaeon]